MGLITAGISHKTAAVNIREKFSFTKLKLLEFQEALRCMPGIKGIIILSTCNRMEMYAHSSSNEESEKGIIEFLREEFNVGEQYIRNYFYFLTDEEAVRHLFRVASGLDSQVLGEREILGQVKASWLASREAGLTDDSLNNLFAKAVDVGAVVREKTAISHGNVSVGSVAVKMLKKRFESLEEKEVLIIGAGKIASLMSKHLKSEGIKGFFVSNRTHAKACELAKECGGEAIDFKRLPEKLKRADIVISSTSSPHIVLKKETIEEIMNERSKPLLLLDLALPRDIAPEVKDLPNVFLYDLDDLKSVIEENFNRRKKEAVQAEEIINHEACIWALSHLPGGKGQELAPTAKYVF